MIRAQAECEAESKWAQRCQRKDEFEYLDRLSIDAGEEQAAGAEDRAGYTVPLVIVSQSADADNVPTTCVILAYPCCVCRCLTLLLSLWEDVALRRILSLSLPDSLIVLCDLVTDWQKLLSFCVILVLCVINERTCWLSTVSSVNFIESLDLLSCSF